MKILFAGTPETAAVVLRGLVSSGHQVVGVLTREDAPVGRKKVLTESPVAVAAKELGIKVVKANKVNDEVLTELRLLNADLGVIVAYGVILRAEALNLLPNGWFNLHYSLLPKYRGAAPVQRAIQNGESETGITIFKLDEGMDTGELLAKLPVLIQPNESAGDLLTRLNGLGVSLLNQELPKIYNGNFQLIKQQGEATLATKPTRQDSKMDFSKSADVIANQIRAFNPEPMAWCLYKEEPFRVLSGQVFSGSVSGSIGTYKMTDNRVVVSCGNNTALELIEVQPSSKKAMPASDWYRGADREDKFS